MKGHSFVPDSKKIMTQPLPNRGWAKVQVPNSKGEPRIIAVPRGSVFPDRPKA